MVERSDSHPTSDIPHPTSARILRVAADPNNLPFSNERLEGFENEIAALLGRELGAEVRYVWRAQRRGFFRDTLKEGDADVVLGVPAGFDKALTTRPYYTSSYAIVTRADRGMDAESLDDPRLRELRIGVQLVGSDGMNTPPAHALAERGMVDNVVGYTLYGDYRDQSPVRAIVDAVATGEIDAAVVWGPTAGYFAGREPVPLRVTPLSGNSGGPAQRMTFPIAVGVRRGAPQLRDEIDAVLERRREEIAQILGEYGVPRTDGAAAPAHASWREREPWNGGS
jgi:mxaJ protein